VSDQPNPTGRFQRRPRGSNLEIGFEITGGFLTISGEQRRQIGQRAIDEAMRKLGRPDIVVASDIKYVPDFSRGFDDARVRVELNVPVSVDPSGKVALVITVPAFQDWGQRVIETVVGFVVAWAQELA
jgi:hypothetical protein